MGNEYLTPAKCSIQTFPAREGWSVDPSTRDITRNLELPPRTQKLQFPTFIQSCLFFDLITSVVFNDNNNTARQFSGAEFVERGNITTKNLGKALED